jgi:hypothetical protein
MSTPVPIKIALVCTIPLLHIPIAQAFGFELYTLPKIVVTSFTFFLLAYISWIVKAPLLAKLWAVMGLDERRAASSMWMADNVHLVSITATYILILSAQKPWNAGYGLLMVLAGGSSVMGLILINFSEFNGLAIREIAGADF